MELIPGIALLTAAVLAASPVAASVKPTADEMTLAHRWAQAKFAGIEEAAPRHVGLVVLANNGPVQLNSRAGKPLRIGGAEYTRGLYCHAVSCVVVQLPSSAKSFDSVIGVDAAAGGGSVEFSVDLRGKEVYRSEVLRCGQPGVPVHVDLDGVREFTLRVGDAGDGISCDQSDWADARVTLADATEAWLGDMQIVDGQPDGPTADPPFSFIYDGKPSSELLHNWRVDRQSERLDENRTQRTLTYTDPSTGLEVRCVGVEYSDFPTIEWTVYLKNTGDKDTPIIEDIQALDTRFTRGSQGEFALHHHVGTLIARNDYEPLDTTLGSGKSMRFAPLAGRSCGGVSPYYNLEWNGEGAIIVVGWPGQWSAEFARDSANGISVRAGQELTHLRLHPGEEIRTPLMAVQFWKGDRARSQNIWRRWMVAHNIPRPGGKLPPPQMPEVTGNHFPGLLCNDTDERLFIDRYLAEGIKPDYWWMDAGWYPNKGDWGSVGTWEVDTRRFPNGLKGVGDYARSKGIKTLVWFEPERVTPDTWITNNHPEWVLGGKSGGLLNLGDSEAWRWVVEKIDGLIVSQAIDLYRQDYNIDPLTYWRGNDSMERQGITENRYVTGYLAFWDELLRRHPNMLIDSCASGGHRNDLETLRRSVPLLRSDQIFDPIGEQCHTYGFASWVPYWGTGFIDFDAYSFRGCMGLNTTLGPDVRRKDLDYKLLRKLIAQWKQVAPNFYGDYYPLSAYSTDESTWMAFQFDRPEQGEGMILAFRRPGSIYQSAQLRLKGLEPTVEYIVKDMDTGRSRTTLGSKLMEPGLLVSVNDRPGSALITYRRR